jgi:16S rRNA (guanine966-N2)-methyltransferase
VLRVSGGRRLQSPPGDLARPTPARVRLAVMNLLAGRLAGASWLDLCSGSGVMACEALQRGAARVVAVERDRRIAAVARANLTAVAGGLEQGRIEGAGSEAAGLGASGRRQAKPGTAGCFELHTREVLAWLGQRARPRGQTESQGGAAPQGFDLIYADPPYRAGLHGPIAAAVAAGGWLRPGGLLLLECASDELPDMGPPWQVGDRRRYGGTTVLLLEAIPGASAAQGAAAAVLVPGGHEQPHQGDGNQTQHDAAEEGFDHDPQSGGQSGHNSFMSGVRTATWRHQP